MLNEQPRNENSILTSPATGNSALRVLVVVGSMGGWLSKSDRAAVNLSVVKFAGRVDVCSYSHDKPAIGYALAAGATQVESPEIDDVDLVVMGRGTAAVERELLAAKLVVRRDASLVFDVLEFDRVESGLAVTRDLGRGAREKLTIRFPIVLVMSEAANSPLYVSRFRQMKMAELASGCHALPLEAWGAKSTPPQWSAIRPRTRARDLATKTTGNAISRMFSAFGLAEEPSPDSDGQQVISADPETCASHLIRYLAHHGLIDVGFRQDQVDPLPTGDGLVKSNFRSSDFSQADSTTDFTGTASQCLSDVELARLQRGPRSLGHSQPSRLRGPFPVGPIEQ